MNKDHKLMSVMIPIIFILSIGFYGIPGAVGSDSDPLITEVGYQENTNNDSSGIISDDVSTEESDNLNQNLLMNENGATTPQTNTRPNQRPPSPPNPPEPEPQPEPDIDPEP